MDLGMLCKSLQETADKDSRLEILIDIRDTVAQLGITFHNIQKFFEILNEELQSKESSLILTVCQILIAILNSDTPEVEPQFPVFFKGLLIHFEDVEVPVREACLDVILQYIRQTRNIENVLVQYNKFGINSPIITVRKKSIKYLPVVVETEKNVFNTPTGQHELRKTVENVIIHLNDGSDLVQKEAEKTLWILWKCYNPFEKIIGKLAVEHQLTFEKRITIEFERMARLDPEKARRKLSLKNIPEVQRIFRMDAGLLERKEEELSPNKKIFAPPNTKEWPISKNGLYFGFVTAAEMSGMTNPDEWRIRLEGVTSVEEKMMAFREFFDLNAYLTSFVNFMKTLLTETHQPILLSLFTILERAINITGSKNKIALHTLLQEVLPKLADNRVVVRQECLYLAAEIATMMKLEVALAVLMKFIEPEQDWHTKEEVLKLIIVCYLKTHNEGLIDFNQELILTKVSQLVDDEKAKVRLGALETLTVICHSTRTTESLEMLARLVDRDAYEVVIDGLEQGKIAYVGDHKVIDFTREKYNFLLNRQKKRQEERLLVEIGSKDAQILNRKKEDDFDWESFVMKEQEGEEGEVDSYEIGENAAGELIKDPDMDLKHRMSQRMKGPGIFAQKKYVEVVDGNTGEYKGYRYGGGKAKNREDANMVLFTKDIPEDVLKRMRGDDDEEEEEEEQKVEEAPVEELPKEPEDKDKTPEDILDEIFNLGQAMEKEKLNLDRLKIIGELKHYKRKKKNRTELYEEQPKDPQEELLMADDQLKPLAFPEFYLENIILDLRIDEWSLQFGALNNLRRVCLYSQEALYNQSFNVHNMISQLLTVFRKAKVPILLRNILLGLRNLFERMGKILDPDIEMIYTTLLSKANLDELTPRTFMEMKYCLGTFIQNLSDDVLTLGLGRFLVDKKDMNQLMPILCTEKLLKKGNQEFLFHKGAGTMLSYVLKNMSSEEYEIRTVARRTFMRFIECGFERKKLERFFLEAVPQDDYFRISEYLRRTDEMMAKREKLPISYKA